MLLRIYNFFKGYIKIEVSGFSVERFVNLATYNGIYLWDIKRSNNGAIIKVSIKGFKLLKKYAKKTGCKIKILNKCGLPFKIYRYKKRKIFAGGLIFFVISLYLLSSFIWLIKIDGNERINSEDLLRFCEKQNLKIGTFKPTINSKLLEKQLLNNFSDISWINIKITGTRAIIQLKETIPKQKIIDRNTPCNIVASKDGLILNVTTSSGTPMVKQKDVVKKGDILVSGEVTIENNNLESSEPTTEYVHAKAQVDAKTYYQINFEIPYKYTQKKYTGKTKKNYEIECFNKKIKFFSGIKYANYDKITQVKQLNITNDYPLPIKIFINNYKEFVPIEKKRSIEQAKDLADKIVTSRIIREFDLDTDIYDKQYKFTNTTDSLKVETLISTVERIDKQVELE